jgi:hypothetical protein
MDDHPGGGLDQRLDHQGRNPLMMLSEDLFDLAKVVVQRRRGRHARRQAVHVGGGNPQALEQQRLEHGVKAFHPAHAHAPQRVAVIGLA